MQIDLRVKKRPILTLGKCLQLWMAPRLSVIRQFPMAANNLLPRNLSLIHSSVVKSHSLGVLKGVYLDHKLLYKIVANFSARDIHKF